MNKLRSDRAINCNRRICQQNQNDIIWDFRIAIVVLSQHCESAG